MIENLMRNILVILAGTGIKAIQPKSARVRVICLHDIGDPNFFARYMRWLKSNFNPISLYDALCFNNLQKGRVNIAITFDDGYKHWMWNAIPVLKNLGIPAVFFVCSNSVGLRGEEAARFCKQKLKRKMVFDFLSEEDLKRVHGHPLFEIGGHTKNHVDLGNSDDLTLSDEVAKDKENLEKIVGDRLRWFAFPFGQPSNVTEKAIDVIKGSGYSAAFTIVPGFIRRKGNCFLIGRDSVDIRWSTALMTSWLNGGYDWKRSLIPMIRRMRVLNRVT